MSNRRAKRTFVLAVTAVLGSFVTSGCNRYEYRQEADDEAYCLIHEKDNDPRWDSPGFTIEMDPRSRYYDVYDEVEPPMPPDDPVSHTFMHHVDGMDHWPYWHQFGDRPDLENPFWKEELRASHKITDEGKVRLALEDAIKLALIHSPDYQQQFETVYLSALDVSTERFRFDVQFFGSFDPAFTTVGEERANVFRSVPPRTGNIFTPARDGSNQVSLDSGLRAERQLSTAGEVLVGFANSTVWEFVGPNRGFTTSLLNFSLVQPLLRNGGRAFALEQLTIAERALLANLRALERYRHGFYTNLAIGNSGVSGPSRRGGFFGGTGLTGFTGQGSGGFGGVGDATGFGRGFGGGTGGTGGGSGTTGFAGGGAGTLGGFLGLLQQLQQIRNSEQSLEAQLGTLELLEAALDAGLIDIAQVDQFRQSIETERATLLQAQNNYLDSLEGFLTGRLGLPPDTPVELDDEMLEPFQFVGDDMIELQNALSELAGDFGDIADEPTAETLTEYIERTVDLSGNIEALIQQTRDELDELESSALARLNTMTEAEQGLFNTDRRRLKEAFENLRTEYARLESALEALPKGLERDGVKPSRNKLVQIQTDLENVVGELSLIHGRARLETITVDPVNLDPHHALEIARRYRLDWMNNRAALVDTWRLIEFNAIALKSDITVRFEGDLQTLGGDNPLKFRDDTGTLRAGLEFDPPFTRLVERNNFRQQLIEYQQSRRQLIQYEDNVHQTLRQLLRQLNELEINLEIQRRAVAIAIRRVDQTREILNQPAPPAGPDGAATSRGFGPTAALNLLTALSDLRSTQNNFLSVWLNHYATRMVLMRELGLMRVDENNIWIDEPLDLAIATAESYVCDELPPEVIGTWLEPVPKPGVNRPDAQTAPAPAPAPLSEEDEDDDNTRSVPPTLPMPNTLQPAPAETIQNIRPIHFEEPASPSPESIRHFPRSRFGTNR
ncbi:TolC family protein [Thalassoroseus pseudoceratinae]|uniref:TolC family protein n=1 Tax=Thalassoroseus pseudoceratinae TaxID=2713176 RepID=UPI0014229484|nr:TolC family protein [Thalassoroseus pseudoceratinae]